MDGALLTILKAIFLLFFSAFFSGAETAIFSIGEVRLNNLQDKDRRAKKIKYIYNNSPRFFSTVVFGNMLVNIAFSALITEVFIERVGNYAIFVAIIVSGILILLCGEIIPKTIAVYRPERLALFSAPLLILCWRIFMPFLFVIDKFSYFISKLLIHKKKDWRFTEDELKTAIAISKKEGYINEDEERFIENALEFKNTEVSEVMTARIDVKGIDLAWKQDDVLDFLRKEKHTRFPVFENSLDNVEGVIYSKDVFLNKNKHWHEFIRKDVFFVPESMKIDDLLREFILRNKEIAVVVDEYGGMAGIVTFEDIIEEIFGEIYDEFETPSKMIEKIDDKSYRVYAKTPVKNINLELDLSLPEDEDTLSGFLLSLTERIPKPQEKVYYKGIEFIIEKATPKRIIAVIIKDKR